jgi:hypothetical protein
LKIIHTRPPNFDAIAAALPMAAKPSVIFTYGDSIFCPGGGPISPWIMAHERVHSVQQGDDPIAWWNRYIADVEFRFAEELEAHRAEWRAWLSLGNRNRAERRGYMVIVGMRLAGPLYGRMVRFAKARELILEEKTPEEADG